MILASLVTLFALAQCALSLPQLLNVGIVLPEEQRGGTIDFGYKWALKVLNRDKVLLPNTTLVGKTMYVKTGDSFRASKELCKLLGTGVVAILGGASNYDPSLEWKLFWTSATMDIPLFFSTPSFAHYKPAQKSGKGRDQFAVRLAPTLQVWGQLLRELTKYLGLQSVAILYEDERGLMRTQALLREPSPVEYIIVRKVSPERYVNVLKEVKGREIRHLIIDCKLDSLPDLLKAILELQMTSYKYHYILTNLDLSTVNMSDFTSAQVNLTSFQIVDQNGRFQNEKWLELKNFGDEELNRGIFDKKTPAIHTETAFAFDSVMALGLGLSSSDASHTIQPANLSCDLKIDRVAPWTDGLSLLNYITSVDFKGISGNVAFKEGDRSSLKIDITRLVPNGWKRVGMWTPDRLLNITKPKAFWDLGLTNATLLVTCVLEKPYVQLKQGGNWTGNDRFTGFSIELLKKIAEKVHFKYVLEVVQDGKYGVYNEETGEWNGVMKQLIEKSADLAIGAITINHARESVIDFTKPFMNLGISILFKKPQRMKPQIFSFLNPLALEIWLSVVVSYVLVSITMFVVARFSPHEWSPTTAAMSYGRGATVGVVRNQFSLKNSFWYPIGTLMQQGSDLNPKTASTRLIGGLWWFFSIIIVSSYTANLAAFLTVERMTTPIESAEDLAEQSEIAYGSLESGSTMTFFRDSKIETYRKMWLVMANKKPSAFSSSYREGISRVLKGNYAFFMESTTIEYVTRENCNLTQIGGQIDSKDYGIALPIGSPWRDKIGLAILEMQELGVIQQERNKWWGSYITSDPDQDYYCNVDYKKQDTKASALGVDNIGGIFVVLVVGLVIAIAVAICEFCWNARINASSDHVGLCSAMADEARFACRCRGPRRRPALTQHCGRCQTGHSKPAQPITYHDYHTYPHQHYHQNVNGLQALQQ
ncbi:glutamate receptor ionotropic, kainate 2 [Folsomia candida]|uniref:Glutamate receptor ionotropic, kainate 2 n=1 Tax=Folsomia candida TaxID=158441 RepID=A0A226DQK6_FOLCA|nr:glutamate receptor ionotropic, kainate 2 [Folsomia candida]OXA46486.1 Glutamate receptor ionotropic, kainate 2 [Folsomia candida]